MLTSIRGLVAASLFAGAAIAATPALAQDDSGITISGNAALVTEYRFRGVDLSGGDIAIQGGIDLSHSSGFYIGTWGSSLDEDTVGYGHTELDIYGGWTGEVTSGVTADVGLIAYLYPNAGPGDFDYFEAYGSVGFTFGPAETTLGVAYAFEQDSLGGDDNLYLYADVGIGIPNTPVSVSGHIGYTDGFLTYTNDGNAFDWSIGAQFAVNDNLSVGVSYIDAEGDYAPGDYDFTDGAVVGTLSVSF
ncbi:TorF family putative porin [Novosphingobium aquimarinum]|uniref:TorF family putative porin n=1 Tax=Novosphingobium aquimarinum TaxID=2682494 RepID=UPI0012EBA1F1|nr:TorF family putative porin [Novosphingobium aquimarinum]